jgi:hypothetical protein
MTRCSSKKPAGGAGAPRGPDSEGRVYLLPVRHPVIKAIAVGSIPDSEPKKNDTRALQAYLGHRSLQHTVRYTELSPDRFKRFWKD